MDNISEQKSSGQDDEPPVLTELRKHLVSRRRSLASSTTSHKEQTQTITPHDAQHESRSGIALPVAAIKSLLGVIQRSEANTMMGLQKELKESADLMLNYARQSSHKLMLGGRSHISLASGCELFMKHVTRCFLELPDFAECKTLILERGERFADISLAARDRIAHVGHPFVQDGCVVLTHGYSRCCVGLLMKAAKTKHFSIIVLEGRPDAGGAKVAKLYSDAGIPTTIVLDSAMGYVMERVDIVLVGAEGVVENGGIVNKVGTYPMAIVAHSMGKPFYVAAESYKFARLFPLNQSDLKDSMGGFDHGLSFVDTASWEVMDEEEKEDVPANNSSVSTEDVAKEATAIQGLVAFHPELPVTIENPPCDYTPAKYITLLLTDLGVLTPAAVSDELIRLYQ